MDFDAEWYDRAMVELEVAERLAGPASQGGPEYRLRLGKINLLLAKYYREMLNLGEDPDEYQELLFYSLQTAAEYLSGTAAQEEVIAFIEAQSRHAWWQDLENS